MEEFYEAPRIELIFSIHNLNKSGLSHAPHTKLRFYYSEDNQTFNFVGETELIEKSFNPDYKRTLEHNYVFEVNQYVKVELHHLIRSDHSEVLSSLVFSIGNVMGCPGQTSMFTLERKKNEAIGELVVRVHEFSVERNAAIIQCSGHKLPKKKGLTGTVNPYLAFYRNDLGEWRSVYQTEVLFETHGDAAWSGFELKLHKLCSNNKDTVLKIECCHKSKKEKKKLKIYGEFKTTVNRILAGEREYALEKPKSKKKKERGKIVFDLFKIEEKYTLLDYLRGGLKLNLALGVDFTSSNGEPKFLDSLHSLCLPGKMNQYQAVLHNVCNILTHYIHDKRILPLGFGAKPNFPNFKFQRTHNCFPMTGDPANSFVIGLNGVMQAYFNTLLNVHLHGPTFISYVIEEAMRKAVYHKQKGDWEYTVMLIITDGDIHDLERTLPLIQQCSVLPISIIIIGVGDENFQEVSTIHGYNPRVSSLVTGGEKFRDCSQFVKFRDYASNHQKFARVLLSRIPTQICEYMAMQGLKPSQQVKIDVSQLKPQRSGDEEIEYQPNKMVWDQITNKKNLSPDEMQQQTKLQVQAEYHDPKLINYGGEAMNNSMAYQPNLIQQNVPTNSVLMQQSPIFNHYQPNLIPQNVPTNSVLMQQSPIFNHYQPQQNFAPQQSYYPEQQQQQYIPQQQFNQPNYMQQSQQYIPQQQFNQPNYLQQSQQYVPEQQFNQPNYLQQSQQYIPQQQQFNQLNSMQQSQQYIPQQQQQQYIPQSNPNQLNPQFQGYSMQQSVNYNPNPNFSNAPTQSIYQESFPQDPSQQAQFNPQSVLAKSNFVTGVQERLEIQQNQSPTKESANPNDQYQNNQGLSQPVDSFLAYENNSTEKLAGTNEENSPIKQQELNNHLPNEEKKQNPEDTRDRSQVVYSTARYEKDHQDDVKPEIIAKFNPDEQEVKKSEETQPDQPTNQPQEELPRLLGVVRVESVYTITPHRYAKDL